MASTTAVAVGGILCAFASAAGAQLQARDLDSDGAADAYYDSAQHVTWLADANLAASQGLGSGFGPGAMNWSEASSWAAGLDVDSVTGWRLPRSFVPDLASLCAGGSSAACTGRITFDSELSRLWDQVGAGGPFTNSHFTYWTGNTYTPVGEPTHFYTQIFSFDSGLRYMTDELSVPALHAWAVHDGDIGVSPIPEPSTQALLLAGLASILILARRRGEPGPLVEQR
jgi:hypothetical protein